MDKIEAVIFDWNGTLYDDLERLAYGSVVKISETYNISPPTLDEYRQEITASFMKFYYKHGFVMNFSGQGSDGDAKALNVIRKKYYTDNGDKGNIRSDATRTVVNLRSMGIKVGVENIISYINEGYRGSIVLKSPKIGGFLFIK